METKKICFAGFGGQGVLSVGKLLAYAAMIKDKEVSWCPSYGPEMRGGTANCTVIISDEPIGSPVVTKNASFAVVMNEPSFRKFENVVAPGGAMIINANLISLKPERTDIRTIYVPASDIAKELGNPKLMNMVLLGALLEVDHTISEEAVLEAFTKVFGEGKAKFIPVNRQALEKGKNYARALA